MKKVFISLTLAAICSFSFYATTLDFTDHEIDSISMADKNEGIELEKVKIDTVYTIEHPTTQDSLNVVNIVNGVVSIVAVKNPLVSSLLKNEAIVGGIVGLICAIWRRIELRRMRRKNKNNY